MLRKSAWIAGVVLLLVGANERIYNPADAVARARARLGVTDPPEDSMRLGCMSPAQAEQVLLGM